MADPIGVIWTDPPPTIEGPPSIDAVRIELFWKPPGGGSFLFVCGWTVPAGAQEFAWGAITFAPGDWECRAWSMNNGKFATVYDSVSWTVNGNPPNHTPTDSEIPPIEDLEKVFPA